MSRQQHGNYHHRMDDDDINMEMGDYDDEDLDEDDIDDDDDIDDEEDDEGMDDHDDEGGRSTVAGHGLAASGGAATNTQFSSPPSASASSSSPNNNNNNSNNEPVEEDAAIARRRAIQQIMADKSLSEQEKRFRIQGLMSQNRLQVTPPPAPAIPAASDTNSNVACVHYERNCTIVAPCCQRVYGCRICHDELSPAGHPPMNRFALQEIICKNCNTRQSCSNQCVQCQTIFGEYFCPICKLWMTQAKRPFHCHQCGFCRVGGIESFRHCSECCMCISVTVFETHQCFKDKYKNNCPVCREDMFSSRQSPQDLPCGHAIHSHCFRKLAGFDYRCPICKKTVVSQQSMAAAWEARARDIEEHPIPADLQRVVDIMCNDCETKSPNRQWHFLGIQCPQCSSFNTVVEQVLSTGGTPEPNSAGAG